MLFEKVFLIVFGTACIGISLYCISKADEIIENA